jgi:hypothetical protein
LRKHYTAWFTYLASEFYFHGSLSSGDISQRLLIPYIRCFEAAAHNLPQKITKKNSEASASLNRYTEIAIEIGTDGRYQKAIEDKCEEKGRETKKSKT